MKKVRFAGILFGIVLWLLIPINQAKMATKSTYRSSDASTNYLAGKTKGYKLTFSGKSKTKSSKAYVRITALRKVGGSYVEKKSKMTYFRMKNGKFSTKVNCPKTKGYYMVQVVFQKGQDYILYLYNSGKKVAFYRSGSITTEKKALNFVKKLGNKTNLTMDGGRQYGITASKLSLSKSQIESIRTFTNKLCKGIKGKYNKAKTIYQWIVSHIYYNCSTQADENTGNNNAYFVFKNRYAVCEGYARLYILMLQTQNIPCAYLSGKGNGGMLFDKNSCMHAWVAIYADGRWFYADPTWDSNNEYYSKKKKIKGTSNQLYFDRNMENFAMTHQTLGVENGATVSGIPVTFMNGRITALSTMDGKETFTYPSKFRGLRITAINSIRIKQEFNAKVKTITIPEGYEYMDSYALQYYIGLKNVKLPKSIRNIGKGLLINAPKVSVCAYANSYAYKRCKALGYVVQKR